ncbi:NaeI family type II restriction endonuclease [Streptomyces laculatispora]|uniref:NaeI family type II restriction endonuclease n=1 Tax=Streptomyces laculatispora TaxID=887464 RepID=A0ABY9I7Q4_9ACTN|nr:NaeI family type II restriction endonuclease [Streptomyces laculatispora]WLQ42907.1 NaeI family type II restriction endonuclease [Streptomyces laculatispora]
MTLFGMPGPAPGVCNDPELMLVHQHLMSLDPSGQRFARVLRDAIDQLLDGEHTGRFDWKDLHKTEKTHAGTLVELNLLREFGFTSGQDMDYLIEGIEVDCKFSQKEFGWMIPPEALDEICLVVWADDHEDRGLWSAGLIRADRQKLTVSGNITKKGNRDGKFRLTRDHHSMVTWLWRRQPLKENLLLHLDASLRSRILAPKSGQKKVNELFRRVQRRQIDRNVVRTLAMQYDYMARVRDDKNGTRARPALREEGIIITGDSTNHRAVAKDLGGPVPEKGEFVSFRVALARPEHGDRPSAELDGRQWVAVSQEEAVDRPAPKLPPR